MATLVLSAAGAGAGGAVGGSVMGVSAALLGRAAGATLGRVIDQQVMGTGSDAVERGRVDRFRLTGAGEGTPLRRIFGRVRVPGQVIWASNFREHRDTERASGGKGGGGGASVTTYSYSVSLAVAVCEGKISDIGRIWADGQEISPRSTSLEYYWGGESQQPDPTIAAIEGADRAPAYRGTAYLVFEDLDLTPFGNRVPQFSFEVTRPEQAAHAGEIGSMAEGIQGVALIPGTGEYSLATTPVYYVDGPGRKKTANAYSNAAKTDFLESVQTLDNQLPNCGAMSLVVSWFSGDLRCGDADIRPKVEHKDADGEPLNWRVAGLDRLAAEQVPQIDGRPVYGGTPTDQSVIEAIREINRRDKRVIFYPFILMDQLSGNTLTDPWTGEDGQPPFPWRGRITTRRAPGVAGSSDGTQDAVDEVARFFGTVSAADFQIDGDRVTYSGPDEWSMRRFILHNAALCKAAGGVHAFCVGSEMRSLTQIRGPGNTFPAVAALRDLTAEVRSLLGPDVHLGYAADWSEYFGHTPQDGSGDHFFHLDPLWSDANVDFIGIDNYMPVSDWREGKAHADADAGWESIYDIAYLQSNIAGGEGFDWYYPNDAARRAQERAPITDGAYGEPWIYRYKDLVGWWSNAHHDRIGGVKADDATGWVPQSKPIWFTEYGCAAIDKGTNQPNKFLDPKSSESQIPHHSNGQRDDLMQMQYVRALNDYWGRAANNPTSDVYGGPMVDMSMGLVWAWDARPYPWFPGLDDVWSDGDNYRRGHWLNGRASAVTLSSVVREVCQDAGVTDLDLSKLHGLVRGYTIADGGTGRAAIEPLLLAYAFDVHERDGRLVFRNRDASADLRLSADTLARHPDMDADLERTRASAAEIANRVRLNFVAADGAFEVQSAEGAVPGAEGDSVAQSEVDLVLTPAEGRGVVERWLSEARVARDTAKFALPLSRMGLGAGDVVSFDGASGPVRYRIDRCEQSGLQALEAVRVEPELYKVASSVEAPMRLARPEVATPPTPVFLDLPMLAEDDVPHAPYVAIAAAPWPGRMAIFASPSDSDYALNTVVESPAILGVTQTDLHRAASGVIDNGLSLDVNLSDGALQSVSRAAMLNGANAMAIGDGTSGNWEIFQFQTATLIGRDTYALTERLRGQLGTDALMPEVWPAGSLVVGLSRPLDQISLASSARGLSRHYRIGPASAPFSADSYVHEEVAFEGNGLRPYAPVHLRARKRSDGDHTISWIRRTRVDGDLWSLAETPLGEAREAYRIIISADGRVVREETTGSPTWTYAAADRSADGVTGRYAVSIAQISDRYGPGPAARMDVDE